MLYACQPPSGSCTGNEDICDADTEHCGPDGQCAPNCTNDNNVGTIQNEMACLSTGRWVPECDDSTCEDGEVCDRDAANETFNFCIDMLDAPCDINGATYNDGNGEQHVCVDSVWEVACDQDICAPDYELCQDDSKQRRLSTSVMTLIMLPILVVMGLLHSVKHVVKMDL